MSSVTKVLPSSGGAQPACSNLVLKKASNGIELMPDETEEFTCTYITTVNVAEGFFARLVRVIKEYLTCSCCCKIMEPEQTWKIAVLVTDKRMVLREVKQYREPGVKLCCYYATCQCCCAAEKEDSYEQQLSIELRDIKEYTCKVSTYRAKQMCCMCCLVSDVNLQSFDADLFLVKNLGETRSQWGNWTLDKELKTYRCVYPLRGLVDNEAGAAFRQVLHAVVARNHAAGSGAGGGPGSTVQLAGGREVAREPAQLNVTLN